MGIDTIPEMFETYDEWGNPLGLVARDVVHSAGVWHRSANVFLYRSNGDLLIQRRSATKDVCPDLWDVSVAEHLQPGEDFEAAAVRGLEEELGLEGIRIEPLGEVVKEKLDIQDLGMKDHEFQQSFRAVSDADCIIDRVEVAEVQEIPLQELARWVESAPHEFTPWFLHRVIDLRLLD